VAFKRSYYVCAACHRGQYPLDQELGYEPGQLTPRLLSAAALMGAALPYERGGQLLATLTGVSLSENTIREATQRVGEEVMAQEEEWVMASQNTELLNARDRLSEEGRPKRLYGSLDGVLVPVEGGEEEWRELKVGSWYTEAERKPDSTSAGSERPPATQITYYCDIATAEDLGKLTWATGVQRLAEHAKELVFVADGAAWIWNLVAEQFPKAVQIVDWYHAVEYIAPIAQTVWGQGSAQGKAWQEQVKKDLWEGHFDQVLTAFQSWRDHPQAGSAAQKAITYYTNNRERMRYPYFRQQDYRIGSGTVESGCKQIGTQRLKVAGARWQLDGARKTAKARTALLSKQWNSITSRFRPTHALA
jgi:hypothetical protein